MIEQHSYTFHQSWTKNFLECPERGRRIAFDDDIVDETSDAAALGTALHLFQENRLGGLEYEEAAYVASEWLEHEAEFAHVQIKQMSTMLKKLDGLMECAERTVVPQYLGLDRSTVDLERRFNVPLSPDGLIRLGGTADHVQRSSPLAIALPLAISDWKTAKNLDYYQQWQVDRWFVQPTTYVAGIVMDALLRMNDGNERRALAEFWSDDFDYAVPFTFHVFTKGSMAEHHQISTVRTKAHAAWMLEQLRTFVALYQAMGPDVPWPKNDQHALCSETWCPAWSDCKGKHL